MNNQKNLIHRFNSDAVVGDTFLLWKHGLVHSVLQSLQPIFPTGQRANDIVSCNYPVPIQLLPFRWVQNAFSLPRLHHSILLLVGRTLSIAIVASLFPLEILLACLLHAFSFGLATFIIDKPTFCSKNCYGSMVFSMLLGCVYVFMYILTKEGKTFFKYLCYYGIYILENIACVFVFWTFALTRLSFILMPLVVLPLALSFFGVFFMIVYYRFYHPNITAREEIAQIS